MPSVALTVLPSQAVTPAAPGDEEVTYEAYVLEGSTPASTRKLPGIASSAGIAVKAHPGARLSTSSRSTPLAVPTEAQEAALAAANYAAGRTYEVDSSDLKAPATSSSTTSAKRKPIDYDRIGVNECKNNFDSWSKIGWTKNHYSWCHIDIVGLYKYVRKDGVRKQVASLTMTRTLRGEGSRENRTVKVREFNDGISTTGQWALGVGLDSGFQCDGSPTFGQCNLVGGQYSVVRTGSSQSAVFTMTSDVKGSKGRDKRGIMVYKPWSAAIDAQGAASTDGYTQGMRCDSAPYMKPVGRACIFDRVEGTIVFSRKDKKVNEAAKHMYTAQRSPGKTFPKFRGKTIPITLHRSWYDKARQKRNTAAAIKVCKAEWGKNYAKNGDDCDEYPFKTTLEGAAKGDRRFSARPVNLHDNRAVGSRLGKWYDADHIIDGDPFHVRIK